MPVQRVTVSVDGRRLPAFRWGAEGHPYPYEPADPQSRDRARRRAMAQGQAIEAAQARRDAEVWRSDASDIDLRATDAMKAAAKRALEVRAEKPPSQRGMTAVGLARARDIIRGAELSPDTWRRMLSFFQRHEVDKQGATWDEQGKGWQAWNGWGGDAGYSRARRVVASLDRRADARAWGIDEPRAPSPRAYEAVARRYARQVDRWAARVAARLYANAGKRADADDDEPPEPPSEEVIAVANAPAARQSQRAARAALIAAGMMPAQVALRLGVQGERIMGLDIAASEADRVVLRQWAREGSQLLGGLPQRALDRMARTVAEALREGWSQERVASTLAGLTSGPWAQVIARDQIGKLNGRVVESTHRQAGVSEYIWHSVRDERTRASHRALHGTRLSWSGPGAPGAGPYGEAAHPGEAIQCRCFAYPVVED